MKRALIYEETDFMKAGWTTDQIQMHTVPAVQDTSLNWVVPGLEKYYPEARLKVLETLVVESRQRESATSQQLRTARRRNTAYRWLALAGWALAVTALAIRPAEAADMTLPKGMLACDSRAAWSDQSQNLGAGLTVLAPGCVFTNRDLRVEVIDFKVFSGTEVYVRDVDLTIFVDGGVLK